MIAHQDSLHYRLGLDPLRHIFSPIGYCIKKRNRIKLVNRTNNQHPKLRRASIRHLKKCFVLFADALESVIKQRIVLLERVMKREI